MSRQLGLLGLGDSPVLRVFRVTWPVPLYDDILLSLMLPNTLTVDVWLSVITPIGHGITVPAICASSWTSIGGTNEPWSLLRCPSVSLRNLETRFLLFVQRESASSKSSGELAKSLPLLAVAPTTTSPNLVESPSLRANSNSKVEKVRTSLALSSKKTQRPLDIPYDFASFVR